MPNSWFKDWFNSPYYHQLYAHRDENEAAVFITNLIKHLQPKDGAKMLDVACGKGRHSMQLAAGAFDVTGIDLSKESIAAALKEENDHLHFYVHDMRLPFWINYFDYTLNLFTSFGYFNTLREHDNAIRTMAQSLKPGGIFLMDYLNVQFSADRTVTETENTIGKTNYRISKWSDAQHFYKNIIVTDDALATPLQYTEKVSKFSLSDFKIMFSKQGLVINEIYGDYHLAPYDPTASPRLIMIAQKSV